MATVKHVPLRTCIICGSVKPQRELIRLVYVKGEGIKVDMKRRMAGRGAYICRLPECLKLEGAGRRLEKAFRTSLPSQSWERLVDELKEIADGERR